MKSVAGFTLGLCVMGEMIELIVILLSPITAFTAMMFGELRGAHSKRYELAQA